MEAKGTEVSWFKCHAEVKKVTCYDSFTSYREAQPKDERIKELERELKQRPPHPDSLLGLEMRMRNRHAEDARKEHLRKLTEELKDKSFRLEEITAHRDALVHRLEEKQQELADCRAMARVKK